MKLLEGTGQLMIKNRAGPGRDMRRIERGRRETFYRRRMHDKYGELYIGWNQWRCLSMRLEGF